MKCFIHGGPEVSKELLVEHHKHPTGFGGPDVDENIILICASCHDLLHKIAEAIYYNKPGKAGDLASQYLPNDPRRRGLLMSFADQVAAAKREYYERNPGAVPEEPEEENEREIIVTLYLPESIHSSLKAEAADLRHGSGRKVGLYRLMVEILRAHAEKRKPARSVEMMDQWDLS